MSARIGAVAALLGALACHKAHPQQPPPECAQREDCAGGLAGGLVCQDGKCVGCARG